MQPSSLTQSITDYKKKTSPVAAINVLLPDKLNNLFEDNTVPLTGRTTKTCWLSFTADNVSKIFKRVNPCKTVGPDGIPSRVLRACADQLAGVFMDIFNQSLSQSAVPTCFKMATIVHVPKEAKVTELNDWKKKLLSQGHQTVKQSPSLENGCVTKYRNTVKINH